MVLDSYKFFTQKLRESEKRKLKFEKEFDMENYKLEEEISLNLLTRVNFEIHNMKKCGLIRGENQYEV